MSKASPAFQFYASDFLADENVALMNNRQLGCYIRLLCYCWREKSIPGDIAKIAKLCQEPEEEMPVLWLAIGVCFDQSSEKPDRLIHPRLDAERIKQAEFKKERSESGKRGALARWSNKDEAAPAEPKTAKPKPKGKNSTSSASSSSKKQQKEIIAPDWVPADAWAGYIEMRLKKKKRPTDRAVELLIRKLEKMREHGIDIELVLDTSTVSEWTDIYAPRVERAAPAPWRATPELIKAKAEEMGVKIRPGDTSWDLAKRIDQHLIGSDSASGPAPERIPLPIDHLYTEEPVETLTPEEKEKRSKDLRALLHKRGGVIVN